MCVCVEQEKGWREGEPTFDFSRCLCRRMSFPNFHYTLRARTSISFPCGNSMEEGEKLGPVYISSSFAASPLRIPRELLQPPPREKSGYISVPFRSSYDVQCTYTHIAFPY